MPLTISDPRNSAQEAEILCWITISLCSRKLTFGLGPKLWNPIHVQLEAIIISKWKSACWKLKKMKKTSDEQGVSYGLNLQDRGI